MNVERSIQNIYLNHEGLLALVRKAFAILLRHRDQFPCKIEALIKGYTDFGGTLPKDWFRSALITDFVNTLQLLDSPPERPQLFQQLKIAIQRTIDDWNSAQEF